MSIVASSASAPASASAGAATSRLPTEAALRHAARFAMTEDKPISMDYWLTSITQTACIGVKRDSGEKILVNSDDEYTTNIIRLANSGNEFILITENTIYLTCKNIPRRYIQV